jgi:hypothetical protein
MSTTKRMIELSAIALAYRRDCLRFADRIDLGEELRSRFREDAAHWAAVSQKILRTDWSGGQFSRRRPRSRQQRPPRASTLAGVTIR